MKWFIKSALLWISPLACHAEQRIDERFLDRLAIIESGTNARAVGDNGYSKGMYQISYNAYRDALAYMRLGFYDTNNRLNAVIIRGSMHCQNHGWDEYCMNADTARLVAKAYCELSIARLKKIGVTPTAMNIYMCYNMGYSEAKRHNFDYNDFDLKGYRKNILNRANRIFSL